MVSPLESSLTQKNEGVSFYEFQSIEKYASMATYYIGCITIFLNHKYLYITTMSRIDGKCLNESSSASPAAPHGILSFP